jgi:hypothetical protein
MTGWEQHLWLEFYDRERKAIDDATQRASRGH